MGGRIGWLAFPQLLTYVSAGYTQARFNQVDLVSLIPPFVSADIHLVEQTYNGWFLGTGYEYSIGWLPGMFWKTEYRFADYGSERVPFVTTSTGVPLGAAVNSRKFVQTVRASSSGASTGVQGDTDRVSGYGPRQRCRGLFT